MTQDKKGQLAENILLFCRTLRTAGLPIGPGQVIDAGLAVLQSGIERRDDFYFALRSVLVTNPTQFRLFDQAFHIYFRNPRLLERMMGLLLPTLEGVAEDAGEEEAIRRLLEAMPGETAHDDGEVVIEIDQSESWSRREILRQKDFEQMSLQEQSDAKRMLREELEVVKKIPVRRYRPDSHGHRYDMRRSMQLMLRNNGQLVELAKKRRQLRPPNLILICDISGSMSRYSRMFLHFAHALTAHRQTVHSFVFGTRLTNISHRLADKDVDRALAKVSAEVKDWDGGTRIAQCLKRFNVDWGRRVLGSNSVVLLLSDGLERDTEADLGFQTERLQRSCRQLIWMNPMLRYREFEAKAMGIKAMLPYVDLFLPAHNIASLTQLGQLLSQADRSPGRQAA
ncbi:MAG: VWA domain-containing protein [Gammaproteobacteria bacterium]|nr:MAG: VWA domain-containing protein [Gammaproteobacteria bacterium]